jgi:hypothetical protein
VFVVREGCRSAGWRVGALASRSKELPAEAGSPRGGGEGGDVGSGGERGEGAEELACLHGLDECLMEHARTVVEFPYIPVCFISYVRENWCEWCGKFEQRPLRRGAR